MKRINSRRLLAALGVSVAVAIGAPMLASAQPAPRSLPASPAPSQDRGVQDQADRGGQYGRRDDRLERRLDFLHSQLRITAAQERLWGDFANVVKATSEQGPL